MEKIMNKFIGKVIYNWREFSEFDMEYMTVENDATTLDEILQNYEGDEVEIIIRKLNEK